MIIIKHWLYLQKFLIFRMSRADALAYYLSLTAYRESLATQLTLLRNNLRIMVRLGAPVATRRQVAEQIQRVAEIHQDTVLEIRDLAENMRFPLPPALRD